MNRLFISLIAGIVIINIIFFNFNKISSIAIFEEDFSNTVETGFVTKIIDGDTVVINGESVRLLGIDSAERGEPCYKEAKERVEELVLNKEVLLQRDVTNKDQYKRLLRYIFVEKNKEKIHINILLVKEGLATARFYEDRKYREDILAAEKTARENKIGCKWG